MEEKEEELSELHLQMQELESYRKALVKLREQVADLQQLKVDNEVSYSRLVHSTPFTTVVTWAHQRLEEQNKKLMDEAAELSSEQQRLKGEGKGLKPKVRRLQRRCRHWHWHWRRSNVSFFRPMNAAL